MVMLMMMVVLMMMVMVVMMMMLVEVVMIVSIIIIVSSTIILTLFQLNSSSPFLKRNTPNFKPQNQTPNPNPMPSVTPALLKCAWSPLALAWRSLSAFSRARLPHCTICSRAPFPLTHVCLLFASDTTTRCTQARRCRACRFPAIFLSKTCECCSLALARRRIASPRKWRSKFRTQTRLCSKYVTL